MKNMKKAVEKKKVMVVKNFSARGERYRKGMIIEMTDEEIRRYKEEGFVDDVAKVLGIEGVATGEYPTKQQFDELTAKVTALEKKVAALEGTGGVGASVLVESEESPEPKKRKTTKKA